MGAGTAVPQHGDLRAPARSGLRGTQQALADWRHGRTSWEHWCDATDRSRELFGKLVGVPAERVATGASLSYLVSLVAAGIPDGARVLVPEVDFTSLTWPLLVQAPRIEVRSAPLEGLADAIDAGTDVVAFSAVQSADGAVADLDAIATAAAAHGTFTIVDGSQAASWLPIDGSRFDAVACAAYKWLMSPRGTAFLALSERALKQTPPAAANWFAAEDRFGSYYHAGRAAGEGRQEARPLPAWFSWVSTPRPSACSARSALDAIHEHDVGLANRFRHGLSLSPGNSAIVPTNLPGAEERLQRAGIRAAVRGGALRASFHLYNTDDDVDAALSALLD